MRAKPLADLSRVHLGEDCRDRFGQPCILRTLFGIRRIEEDLRFAFQYDSESQAETVARAFGEAKKRGELDAMVAGMKQSKPETPATEEKKSPTLAEFYDAAMVPLWEATVVNGTAQRYATSFSNHIKPALGHFALTNLTRDRCRDFAAALTRKTAAKRKDGDNERLLAKDSVRNVMATLRVILEEARERDIVMVNQARGLGKFYSEVKKVREEVEPFEPAEIPLVLQTLLAKYGHQDYTMALTLFHTGLRSAELAGLSWSDVDFHGKLIAVRRQYKGGVYWKTKTKRSRKVDMSDTVVKELQTLLKARKEEYLGRGKNEIPASVFLSPGLRKKDGEREEGCPLDMKNWFARVFTKACTAAGVRQLHLHCTRHTFASLLLMNNESIAYVSKQLGHSSIKMTVDTYGHFIPGANRQAVNKLPSLLSSKSSTAAGA